MQKDINKILGFRAGIANGKSAQSKVTEYTVSPHGACYTTVSLSRMKLLTNDKTAHHCFSGAYSDLRSFGFVILQTLTTIGMFWLECLTLFSLWISYGGFFAFKCQQSVLVFSSIIGCFYVAAASGSQASSEQRGRLKKYLLSLLFGRWFYNLACIRFACCKKHYCTSCASFYL